MLLRGAFFGVKKRIILKKIKFGTVNSSSVSKRR